MMNEKNEKGGFGPLSFGWGRQQIIYLPYGST